MPHRIPDLIQQLMRAPALGILRMGLDVHVGLVLSVRWKETSDSQPRSLALEGFYRPSQLQVRALVAK